MNINIKNYTSQVAAENSISKIERLLVKIGAKNINKSYDNGILKAIIFLIDVNNNTMTFKIPAKIDAVMKVLSGEVKRPQPGTFERIREQSERTAWKIVSDWVEIQATMILLEQAEFIEVFLPYHYNPVLDQTLFQSLKANNFKMLNQG